MRRCRQVYFVLLYTTLGILGADLEPLLDTVGLDSSLSIKFNLGEAINLSIASSEWLDLGFNVTLTSSIPPWLKYNHSSMILSGNPRKIGSYTIVFQISRNDICEYQQLQISLIVQKKKKVPELRNFVNSAPTIDVLDISDSCKFRPIKKKPINHIPAISGQLYRYRVRDDVFEDEEDGSTHHLQLSLSLVRSINSRSDTSWLLLDTANQILFGLPMDTDSTETEVVQLIATDSCGLKVEDNITIHVFTDKIPHYKFVMNFDSTFKIIIKRKFYRYKLVSDIENWLKKRIQVFEINSVTNSLTWALQDDVFDDKCDDTIVKTILRNLTNEDSVVTEELRCHLSPYFQVQRVHFIHGDGCYKTIPNGSSRKNSYSNFSSWLEIFLTALVFFVLS